MSVSPTLGVTPGRLLDRVCVVTGAAGGIGRGVLRRFAREGATIVGGDVSAEGEQTVTGAMADFGARGLFLRTDVGRRPDVEKLIDAAVSEFGRVDVLVNAAIAFAPHVPLEDKRDEMWDSVHRVGFMSVVWAMQAAFGHMRTQGGGRIINFDSRAQWLGQLLTADYNSTKGAVAALTRSAAAEWGKYNILCNAIAPAAASLGYHDLIAADPDFAAYIGSLPLGRVGDPETEIAPAAVFLASDDGKFVTGTTINVEGGIDLAHQPYFEPASGPEVDAWLSTRTARSTSADTKEH